MEDEKIVQEQGAVQEETVSKEGEKPEAPKPLDRDELLQILTERDSKMERYFQAKKDKELSSLQKEATQAKRRAEAAESGWDAARTAFGDMSPENRTALELAQLKAKEKHYSAWEQDEKVKEQVEKFNQDFHNDWNEALELMGIDASDKRIDWGEDAGGDYLARNRKIQSSIAKITKEDRTKWEKKLKDENETFKQNLRKELGLDSATEQASKGGAGSDEEFVKKFGSGDIPLSKDNIARYEKITKSY